MKRRDTERNHAYATEVFSYLSIFDIQGLLKEGDVYKCGIEAYQVANFNSIRFELLKPLEEKARFLFCSQLQIPYYIIIISEESGTYQIYDTVLTNGIINYVLKCNLTKAHFIEWWRSQQSFNQKKAMYNAGNRITRSIIDNDLFSNSLAWGVNIDGFTINTQTNRVVSIYEKRICTYKPPYTVDHYDPNRFFHGTAKRSGDFASWSILFALAKKINASLLLFTFDTSNNKKIGASKIIDINKQSGISYKQNIKPNMNLFIDNIANLRKWVQENI